MKDQIEPFLDFSLDERWYFNKIEEKKLFDPLQIKKSGLFDTHFRDDTLPKMIRLLPNSNPTIAFLLIHFP